jgi:hypothetical protein
MHVKFSTKLLDLENNRQLIISRDDLGALQHLQFVHSVKWGECQLGNQFEADSFDPTYQRLWPLLTLPTAQGHGICCAVHWVVDQQAQYWSGLLRLHSQQTAACLYPQPHDPVHDPSHLLKTHFNIILPSRHSPQVSPPTRFKSWQEHQPPKNAQSYDFMSLSLTVHYSSQNTALLGLK